MKKVIKRINKWLPGEKNIKIFLYDSFLLFFSISLGLITNDWYNDSLDKNKESQLLNELQGNLLLNIQTIEGNLILEEEKYDRTMYLLNHLRNNNPYDSIVEKTFKGLVWLEKIELQSSAYSTLKSIGLGKVKDDRVRKGIIQMYEVTYPSFITKTFDTSQKQLETYSFGLIAKYFSWDPESKQYLPNNYQTLFNNKEFVNMVSLTAEWTQWRIRLKREAIYRTNNLIKIIEEQKNE